MIVVREECILDKIDKEINKDAKPVIRIGLNPEEFEDFLKCLEERMYKREICSKKDLQLYFKHEVITKTLDSLKEVGRYSISFDNTTYLGCHVVYKGICIQCCMGAGPE